MSGSQRPRNHRVINDPTEEGFDAIIPEMERAQL